MLPGLNDVMWEHPINSDLSLPSPLQLDFKRSKLKIEIIQKESDVNAKFEVFERLNTGGSFLSYQEVRNCLLIMINKDVFSWLHDLANLDAFLDCASLSDRLLQEQYNMELALRYLICANFEYTKREVNEFLTDSLMELCKTEKFDFDDEKKKFIKLLSLLNSSCDEKCFKKYDGADFKGKFLESAYEAITLGLGANLDDHSETSNKDSKIILDKIIQMWSENGFTKYSGSGSNAQVRIPKMIKFGHTHFKK
jgi:hypothetical protein